MKNLARNISLGVNLILVMLLLASGGWIWRASSQEDGLGAARRRSKETIHRYESFIANSLMVQKLVGRSFPQFETVDVGGRKISTDFSTRRGALVLLFRPEACQPCLITQLKGLQHITEALEDPSSLAVYGFGSASEAQIKRFTRAFGLRYPLISERSGALFKTELGKTTPTVVLVDQNNTIIEGHIPTPGREEFSILFFNEVRRSLQEKLRVRIALDSSSFGLTGVPVVDVIRNEFDHTNANVRRVMF